MLRRPCPADVSRARRAPDAARRIRKPHAAADRRRIGAPRQHWPEQWTTRTPCKCRGSYRVALDPPPGSASSRGCASGRSSCCSSCSPLSGLLAFASSRPSTTGARPTGCATSAARPGSRSRRRMPPRRSRTSARRRRSTAWACAPSTAGGSPRAERAVDAALRRAAEQDTGDHCRSTSRPGSSRCVVGLARFAARWPADPSACRRSSRTTG